MKINKYIVLMMLSAFVVFFSSCEIDEDDYNNQITIEGEWEYNMISSTKITTTVSSGSDGRIMNNRSTSSGSLKLKLYLTSSKYDGGSISGYAMADYTLKDGSPLEGGHYYYDITFSDTNGFPPYGTYYVTLVLLEYDGDDDTYYIEDYLNFSNLIKVYYTSFSKESINFQEEQFDMAKY